MRYTVTATHAARTMRHNCDDLADVIDTLSAYQSRIDVVPILHALLSGLESVVRIDDIWLTVAPLRH